MIDTASWIGPDGKVQLGFKRPWSDGTNAVVLAPHAFIARLAAIIPPPRRHVTRYFGVLSSHSALRARIIPTDADATTSALPADTRDVQTPADATPPGKRKSKYIPWNELLRRTFNVDVKCANCKGDLRLIALIKTQATIKKILAAMGLPTLPPVAAPARAPPCMNFYDWDN